MYFKQSMIDLKNSTKQCAESINQSESHIKSKNDLFASLASSSDANAAIASFLSILSEQFEGIGSKWKL